MKKKIFITMLFITGIAFYSQAQNRIIDEINYEHGLQTAIDLSRIFQDSRGFLWMGSMYGVQRYDGYEFVNFNQFTQEITRMDEDRKGLLWFETHLGVYVMDPETEEIRYFVPPHKLQSRNNGVYKVLEDANGIIWCGANYGLYKMVPKVNEDQKLKELIFTYGVDSAFNITVFRLNKTDTTELANVISDIYEDSRGRIWVGGNPGFLVYDSETDEFMRLDDDSTGKSRFENGHIWTTIVEESPDVMWVRIYGGFTRISNIERALSGSVVDKSVLDFRFFSPDFSVDYGWDLYLRTFLMDNQKNFWFGTTDHGLAKMNIDPNGNASYEKVYPEMDEPAGGLFGCVYSIIIDQTGLIWASHESDRIKKIREGGIQFAPLEGLLAKDPPLRYDFSGCYRDESGNFWVLNWGDGLYRISEQGNVTNFKLTDQAVSDTMGNYTWCMLEVEEDVFWVGAQQGIWLFDARSGKSKKILTDDIINVVVELSRIENYILIDSNPGFYVYDMKTQRLDHYTAGQNDSLGLKSDYVTSMEIMKNDEIWVAAGRGVSRWVAKDPSINRFTLNRTTGKLSVLPLPEEVHLSSQLIIEENREINSICEDRTGAIWFGTSDGLIRLNVASGEMRKWTREDGLCNNNIHSIQEDDNGYLWLAGTDGLSVIDPVTFRIRTFTERDGLPKVRHYTEFVYKDKEGLMYFGGLGGFYSFNPDFLYWDNVIPTVVVTDFRLFNESVRIDSGRKAVLTKNIAYTNDIDLKYNQNDLAFTFAALDYNDPDRNKYSYILEGYQDTWIETGADNRIAKYTNLNAGAYVFRVKGSNSDGLWNEEGTFINIIIHPPFWKTTLAYIAYGIIFLLLLRGYIFWRIKRIRKEKMVLEKQVNKRTAELKTANAQLKEHEQELQEVNTQLEEQQEELQEVNTLLEEQKEELLQQKEELQSTLESLQKMQEQLVESEKMAAVGGLVAGVAHEINTPVGIGITAISNLQDDIQRMAGLYEKDEISREDFREFLQSSDKVSKLIQKNLQRTASLVQSFKQVSTDQVTEQQRVFALGDYLNDILGSLQPKFSGKKIEFKIQCDDELKLNSYPGVFAQIFTNLILNSLQHGFHESKSGIIKISAEMEKDMLKIKYNDDGSGISKKDLPHIFEPFYTSDQRRGTGLGLNIIYNLVKQKLNGTIACESETGKGVLFKIEVPAT